MFPIKTGNTPLINLSGCINPLINLYIKLESYNPTGSIKDRAAFYILNKLLSENMIDSNTEIIESSSGNFGIALAYFCKMFGVKFTCVIDPNILPINEILIQTFGGKILKATERDEFGGYLINRINIIKDLLAQKKNLYWVNQYENPLNAMAYYETLGNEICNFTDKIDYFFIGVSSGGTITGLSMRIKEKYPSAKIIAVDVDGSIIFGGEPKKRIIPGIGSSIIPKILQQSHIDDVVIVSERETIDCCHELLHKYYLFAGGSSGSVYAAIKKYFSECKINEPTNVLTIFPDRGDRYVTTIYDECWCKKIN
jgi:cysteine synthase A